MFLALGVHRRAATPSPRQVLFAAAARRLGLRTRLLPQPGRSNRGGCSGSQGSRAHRANVLACALRGLSAARSELENLWGEQLGKARESPSKDRPTLDSGAVPRGLDRTALRFPLVVLRSRLGRAIGRGCLRARTTGHCFRLGRRSRASGHRARATTARIQLTTGTLMLPNSLPRALRVCQKRIGFRRSVPNEP